MTLPTVSTPVALLFVVAVLATTAVLRLVRQRQLRREAGRWPAVVAPLAAAVAPPTAASPAASIYTSSNAKSDDWQVGAGRGCLRRCRRAFPGAPCSLTPLRLLL